MIRNNLSWINLNAGSSGGSGGGGVSDYNDLANRPIISMTGTSQNPLKLWNLSTGLYLLNGYVYYNTTNTRECVNLFVSITAQIQNGKYVLSAFVPSWEGHYEYIKANSTSTEYTDTQVLKMLTEDDVLTLTNEVEYTPTTDYHPSTKKYVDEAMQSVMEEFAKMGVNEQDIKTLIAENRRRDIAIQALLNETADKNVTIEEDTHTISLDYSMEDGMATVNSIEGSTLVNVSKTVDEVYVTKSQDRVEQSKVANTIGEQNGKLCPIFEGDTLVNVCNQKDPIAITKSYTVENSGNHITLQGEYDGKCRPVIQGNTMVNLVKNKSYLLGYYMGTNYDANISGIKFNRDLSPGNYTILFNINSTTLDGNIKNIIQYNDDTQEYPFSLAVGSTGKFMKVFSLKDTPKFIKFYTDNSTEGEVLIDDLMLFEGDLTQTPELIPTEYVEGLKNSFEDNVVTQAMVDSGEESAENLGKYKVEYKVTGKNKFEFGKVISGDAIYLPLDKPLKRGGYRVTSKTVQRYENRPTIEFRDEYGNVKSGWLDDNSYMALPGDIVRIALYSNGYNWSASIGNPIDFTDIQIEEGSTATPYEPYKEYTKTFYLNSPLLEGDTIEDINGVATHVKRYNAIRLTGDESWKLDIENQHLHPSTTVFWDGYLPNGKGGATMDFTKLFCNNFSTTHLEDEECIHYTRGGNPLPYITIRFKKGKLPTEDIDGFKQWLQANPTIVVYELASPVYEPISTESILCDSYVNGHLDFDSAVPVEKVSFRHFYNYLKYLKPNTYYTLQFDSDNEGVLNLVNLGGDWGNTINSKVTKGINRFRIRTGNVEIPKYYDIRGIGFNASNIVVTEATDKDFDYFNGIQSTFEENLVTDENNPHYGKYRVIYRTKSSDGNASTVKSVYLNSPLLQGDKLVVVNSKLCHYHKMGMVVLDGSENWRLIDSTKSEYPFAFIEDVTLDSIPSMCLCNNLPSNYIEYSTTSLYKGNEYGVAVHKNIIRVRLTDNDTVNSVKQWLQANPITVVYELASPYYEEISSNPKDTVVDFYANGTLEVQSAVYPLSMEFTSFEEELTYLYASTAYTVQFEANGNAIANITLGGTTVTNQEITHGLNKIQVTTPSTLVDNKLIIDGCGDCKISKIVVTNSTEEFEYFEGMKSAFEDKQNEDGTYTVEIVVYNAPIRLNKDKE